MRGCLSSTLLYGDTSSGKTGQCASWAKWVYKETGKRVRMYTAEPGGLDTIGHFIDDGLIEVWDVASRQYPGETIEFASMGYWPDPGDPTGHKALPPSSSTWEEVGGLIFEGGTSFGDLVMEELRLKAAKNEIIGTEKAPAQYTSGELRIAGSGMAHFGIAQGRLRRAMNICQKLPVHILWTCRETKATDDEMVSGFKEIFGPQLIGQALTPHIPAWFGRTIHLDLVKEGTRSIRKAFFKTHFYEGSRTPYVANPRLPPEVADELPESRELDKELLTMIWLGDTIKQLREKARTLIKKG